MDVQAQGNLLRKRAEEILSQKKETLPKPSPGHATGRLIHELQVHQIELEMQNEELRKAQEEIEESRSRYVDLYDFAPVGYFTLDEKGVILEANLTGASLLGVERGLLLKRPFILFVSPEDWDLFRDCQRKVFQTPGKQSCELRLNRKDGNPLWVGLEGEIRESPDGKSTRLRLVLLDITDRRRSEEALSLQEKERKLISNEIHEGLFADLELSKYTLELKIALLKQAGNPLSADLQNLLNTVLSTMKKARRIMQRLHPPFFDKLELIPAMNTLSREVEKFYPPVRIECKLGAKEDEIPNRIKVIVFRVAQEALANSIRHGKGNLAKISLTKSSDRIEFMAQDNGQGFNLKDANTGAGLESMREWVELSGGTFKIESAIGQGTTIRAIWTSS